LPFSGVPIVTDRAPSLSTLIYRSRNDLDAYIAVLSGGVAFSDGTAM
jgi:hypothetical protein